MTNHINIKNIRRSYSLKELNESSVKKDPFEQFILWMDDTIKSKILDPSAVILATANKKAIPSIRVVLLKEIEKDGLIFYTNYGSHKAKDITENPVASLLFFWKELERQVRITGKVEKIFQKKSEEYFQSRPYDSQLGAVASRQSSIIPSRKYLEQKFEEAKAKYKSEKIPLPFFWGGYILRPFEFEFWQGRESRLHDRLSYIKENNNWKIVRLAP